MEIRVAAVPDSARQVLDLLRGQIKENNAVGILVTHSRAAADTTDRVYLLTAAGIRETRRGAVR